MTEEEQNLEAAQWLVVAYVRHWTMQTLEMRLWERMQKKPGDFQFLPRKEGVCRWVGNSMARAYVAQNFPKLAAYLDRATPEQQVKVAHQIVRLKWNGKAPQGALTASERRELARDRKEARAAGGSYRLSRDVFKSHSPHQWNVCS